MAEKRPPPSDGPSQDSAKRPRSNNASPAPLATMPATNGQQSKEERIAAARELAKAKMAKIMGSKPASPAPATRQEPPPRPSVQDMEARIKAAQNAAQPSQPASMQMQQLPPQDDNLGRGLGAALHPLLMGDAAEMRSKSKQTTLKDRRGRAQVDRQPSEPTRPQLDLSGPSLDEIKQNPYYDPNISGAATARGRKSREIVFNEHGKYKAQAAALRRQHQLEEMKARIAKEAKLAGLDEDRSDQMLVIPQPPKIEWWDEALVIGADPADLAYPDFEDDGMIAQELVKIDTEDSIITRYIQHPVLLEPPQSKTVHKLKELPLTKEEQAKKRRQTRRAILQEKQAKQRLGLIEPEKPKVSQKNLMRVLGEEAVRDPTAIEARVNREIAERREQHEAMNAERQLSKDDQHDKLAKQQEADAAKGLLMAVYRVDSLAYGKHRYQIDVNAKQHALTGITILNPRLNLVIVEGGEHSIRQYDKLMTQRIKWQDIAVPHEKEGQNAKVAASTLDKEIAEAKWLQPQDDDGQLKDQSENRCIKVWEGEVKQRAFKKWGSRVAYSDGDARSFLERAKMENMWVLAKNWVR